MVRINKRAVADACAGLSREVHGLKGEPDCRGLYKSSACVCCDKLLRWCDGNETVSLKFLKSRRKSFVASKCVHPDLEARCACRGRESESWMDAMLLSPRSVWVRNTEENPNKGTPGFRCCGDCSPLLDKQLEKQRFKLPERAIANGHWIGEAPKELQQLMTEVAQMMDEPVDNDGEGRGPEKSMTPEHLRSNGAARVCSMDVIKSVCGEIAQHESVCEFAAASIATPAASSRTRALHDAGPKVTKDVLMALTVASVRWQGGSAEFKSLADVNPNGAPESIKKWAEIAFTSSTTGVLDVDQKRSFEVIISAFIRTYWLEADIQEAMEETDPTALPRPRNKRHQMQNLEKELLKLGGMKRGNDQLILFLTGAGGSGKSEVINNVLRHGKGFCQSLGQPFNSRTIVVTALTGVAAASMHGETLASAALLRQRKVISAEQIKEWENSRLLIIDESSFAKGSELVTLHKQLSGLKEVRGKKHGGLNIAFAGDFRQLKPVKATPLCEDTAVAHWHDWINCFIELRGNHRFGNDPRYGEVCERFRNGEPTDDDFDYVNERVFNVELPDGSWSNPGGPTIIDVPSNTAHATPTNRDRCAINDNVFAKHLEETQPFKRRKC